MVHSKAAMVEQYLAELPAERRAVVAAVREVIVANLPEGYREAMNWGIISYEIPLEVYPKTYNGQPLMYAGLAAQKNNYSVHIMCLYQDAKQLAALEKEFAKAGKKLDIGKACIRFKRLEDLPLDSIGKLIAKTPPANFIQIYEAARKRS